MKSSFRHPTVAEKIITNQNLPILERRRILWMEFCNKSLKLVKDQVKAHH